MDVYIRQLSLKDLDSCSALETAAFPPSEAATREKFEYRLTVCLDICFGLFLRGDAKGPIQLPESIPYILPEEEPTEDTLLAHAISTRSNTRTVKDEDMKLPNNWEATPQVDFGIGHQPNGKTIALHSLAVSPKCQRSGLGKALLKCYIDMMKESGQSNRISILTYDRLVPYYEKQGFKNLGRSASTYAGVEWLDLTYEFSSP